MHPMAGADRRRLPRDSLGLGLSSLLQASPNLPFHPMHTGRSRPRVGVAGDEPRTSISRLLRSSAAASSEAGQSGNKSQQGADGTGEPQNPAGNKSQRMTMGEIFGRGRRERGDEGDVVACPEISMGGFFHTGPHQGASGAKFNDHPGHLTPSEALGPGFWKLERTTLVNRELPREGLGSRPASSGQPLPSAGYYVWRQTHASRCTTCGAPIKGQRMAHRTESRCLNSTWTEEPPRTTRGRGRGRQRLRTCKEGQQEQESHRRVGGGFQREIIPGGKEGSENDGDKDHQGSAR